MRVSKKKRILNISIAPEGRLNFNNFPSGIKGEKLLNINIADLLDILFQ